LNYFIGIDGGGTKTKGLLADESGNVIASAAAGPSNPNAVKEKDLASVFYDIFSSMEQQQKGFEKHTVSLYAGISGAGNKENEKVLRGILKKLFPEKTAIKIEADAVNALYAGTYGEPGIVQISGTGSITYGKNSRGTVQRVGGWGYLFGDEGSGYDIGRRAVTAALKAFDGRGPETVLLQMLYAHFQVDNPQDLIRRVYTSPSPKKEISPLSQIVFHAYKQNDSTAKMIVNQTADELALNITALYKKIFTASEKTTIVLSGGIFQERDIIPKLLREQLDTYKNLKLVLPDMSPAGGALIGAFLMQESLLDKQKIKNIIHTE